MRNPRTLLFVLFFISGFSGLIYESIWTHYLKLFLGHAAYAQTLVLAIFMGGMAIGAWFCSKISIRWRNLLIIYALIEGVIGVAALLFHPVFVQITQNAFTSIIPRLDDPTLIHLFKWSSAGLLILPQSILLGMTFPLMSSGLIRFYPSQSGNSIAMLYFTNSFGGAVGVLISGFVTIKWLGLDGTIVLAGAINILLALIVWLLFRKQPRQAQPISQQQRESMSISRFRVMLVVALLTGVASFIYEIAWIRMLSLVLGSSTHAFELMLSAFIFGLATGGLWISRRIDRLLNPIIFLAGVQIVMGLAALSTLPLYGQTFNLMHWFLSILDQDASGYLLFNLFSHSIAMLIMFPTAFCAGMTLPLITYELLKAGTGERAIGAVYGINTLGAIIGIVVTVHLGFPYLGTKGALLFGAFIDIALGLYLLWRYHKGSLGVKRLLIFPASIGTILLVALLVELSPHQMASGVYRKGELLSNKERVVSYKDGKTATISMTASTGNVHYIRTNGKADASINMQPGGMPSYDEITMTLTAAIPMLLKPDAKQIANIGFGSGMTSHVILANPHIEALDTIEIEPEMVTTAKAFRPYNIRVFSDDRSKIHYEDAKTFFSANNKKYDIIISEPSNPWVSGVSGLFTREFYHNIKYYLNDNGMVAQWVQIYEFDITLLVSILKAVSSQFSDYVIYALNHGDILILASDSAIADLTDDEFSNELGLSADLARINVNTSEDLRLRWLGDRKFLASWINNNDIPTNSDYFPFVDQNAAKARFMSSDAKEIFFSLIEAFPVRAVLGQRELSNTNTNISISPLAMLSYSPYKATYVLSRMTANTTIPVQSYPQLQPYINESDKLVAECKNLPAHGDKVYLLYNIAVSTVPFLNPEELEELWSAVEKMACGSDLNEYVNRWLALFKAISRRDTTIMQQLSLQLLKQPQYLNQTRIKYLMGINMLSLLADQKYVDARQFWQEYSSLSPEAAKIREISYLLMLANSAGNTR